MFQINKPITKIVIFVTLFCQSSLVRANEKKAFDVNDVSFLLPLQHIRIGKPYPKISASNGLINKYILNQILNYNQNLTSLVNGHILASLKNWYVTSARYEKCGLEFQHTNTMPINNINETCIARFKIVLQPYNTITGKILTSALHLSFKLTESQITDIENKLFKIKKIGSTELNTHTNGKNLTVSPALIQELNEGKEGKFSKSLASLILKYAKLEFLEILTATLHSKINTWTLIGGLVEDQNWHPFTDRKTETYTCDTEDVCIIETNQLPESPNNTNINEFNSLLYVLNLQNIDLQKKPDRNLQIVAENIENTSKTNFFNTDCISCHVTSKLRSSDRIWTNLMLPKKVTPFVKTRYRNNLLSDVINFGYSRNSPKISLRTASESADVANDINNFYNLKPTRRPIEDLESYWKCLNSKCN